MTKKYVEIDGKFVCKHANCVFVGKSYNDILGHIYYVHKHSASTVKDRKVVESLRKQAGVSATNGQAQISVNNVQAPSTGVVQKSQNGKTIEIDVSNGVTVLPIHLESAMPRRVPDFVDRPDIEFDKLFDSHLDSGFPLMLTGPKGEGKTLAAQNYAYQHKYPLVQYDCSEDSRLHDFAGHFILKGDETVFVLGAVSKAITIANEVGVCVLVLEEINALTQQMQKALNATLDFRGKIYVQGLGRDIILNRETGAKLLVVATRNPNTYTGIFELNEDFRSRFAEQWVGAPKASKQAEIVETTTKVKLPKAFMKQLSLLAYETQKLVDAGAVEYALSTRDIVRFVQIFESYQKQWDKETAYAKAWETVILCNYHDQKLDTLMTRVNTIFGNDRGFSLLA